MYSIINSDTASEHLEQFRKWVEKEWESVDSFGGTVESLTIPAPILAVEDEELLAGLGFTSAPKPASKEIGVWVNVLLVAPKHRNRGIGSQLVQAAEGAANKSGLEELFVYTHIPALYQRLDWVIADSSNEFTVLRKEIRVSE